MNMQIFEYEYVNMKVTGCWFGSLLESDDTRTYILDVMGPKPFLKEPMLD